METSKTKNVLVCPLDWGLGYAARCIPIIQLFIQARANIIIAADHKSLAFLRHEFPKLQYIRFASSQTLHPIKRKKFCFPYAVKTLFKMWRVFHNEKKLLRQYIHSHDIDIVVSDRRFGLSSSEAYCILLCHCFYVETGARKCLDYLITRLYSRYINKFDECWIPDYECKENLSGKLSYHRYLSLPIYYVGPISRFSGKVNDDLYCQDQIDVLAIISGPEQEKTQLRKLLVSQLKITGMKAILVGDRFDQYVYNQDKNITFYPHLSTDQLLSCIKCAKTLICRSGYSSIMDLSYLGKPAIFVPIPNQFEQVYLASYHESKGNFYYQKQERFNLMKAIEKLKGYTPIKITEDKSLLKSRISYSLNHCSKKH